MLYILFFFGNWCISKLERSLSYGARRFASLLLSTFVAVTTIYLFATHPVYVRYAVAMYYVGASLTFLGHITGTAPVQYIYKVHDYVVGHTLFFLLGVMTIMQV